MINLRVSLLPPLNRHHIEPARSVVNVMASYILRSHLDQLVLLVSVNSMNGAATGVGAACFDFDEHQHGPVL